MSTIAQNTPFIINDYALSDSSALTDSPIALYNDSNQNDSSIIDIFTTDTHRLITHTDSVASVLREGIYAEKRPTSPAENPWIVGLLILSFAFFAISYRRGAKYLKHLFTSLFKAKNRGNLFDETTINENQLRLSLIILTFITEGIALYHAIIAPMVTNSNHIVVCIAFCILICALFYVIQKGTYIVLGNIFSTRQQTDGFLENFTSTNILIGLFFTPFILVMLFMPGMTLIAAYICLVLYILARFIIIYKGVRFFLPHIYNFLYIILYLCALEIIPLILIRKLVVYIYEIFLLNTITT